ncbi:MAG: response regulator [Anaerolineae bacterium]|jgi:CheY-like chemotaxis protein|nr:response regulator [Anaerolineae bacterium]
MTKVMVVDDDPDFVEIVSIILRKEGYEIDSAADGDAALTKMRASPPDIALLDVMMSTVLDGVNVSFAMSEDPQLKSVPIVMISSIPDSPNADQFPTDEYVPIAAWITKPAQPDHLLKTVKRLVS